MPTYEIQAPDGNIYRIDGPAGATDDQVRQQVLSQHPTAGNPKSTPKPEGALGKLGKEVFGAGEAALNLATGIPASLGGGLAYGATLAASQNTDAAKAVQEQTQKTLTYQPSTPAGQQDVQAVGNLMNAAIEKPSEAAGELARRGVQAVGGSAQASGVAGAAVKTGLQAIPMAAGVKTGTALEGAAIRGAERVAERGEAQTAVRAAEEAPKQAKIAQARELGLKIPPSEGGGPVGKALEGASGKIQTEMAFSRANSKVINRTAAKEIGLSDRQSLTEANIERLKQQQFQVYERVKKAGRIESDEGFRTELDHVRERTAQAQEDYPEDTNELIDREIKKFDRPSADASSMLEKIKSLRNRASRNMQAPDAEKFELGLAQKKIATAMESLIERNVPDQGLIRDFRQARVNLAKIYNVEDALSPNGNVSAAVLARQLKRGVPLSGGLKTIAQTYQEFPKVMRYVDSLGGHAPFSALDYLVGGVEAAAMPHKAAAIVGALALRPLARAAIKSETYQKAAIKPREVKPGLTTRVARRIAGPTLKDRYEMERRE
jgi:hypothetical protein